MTPLITLHVDCWAYRIHEYRGYGKYNNTTHVKHEETEVVDGQGCQIEPGW